MTSQLFTVAHKCHGKTFFSAAKVSFSRQNFLSHGKTFFLTAKLPFRGKTFLPRKKLLNETNETTGDRLRSAEEIGADVSKMAAGCAGNVMDCDGSSDGSTDDVIREYFFKGFTYNEICLFLERNHACNISLSTFKRKIKQLGLYRRVPDYDMDVVRASVVAMLDGPQSNLGYRAVWHDLQMRGMRVPRAVVANLLRELDPQGVQDRRAHRLRRRLYQNNGPNAAWHCDGYDKLKPYGFPIHGCIDGWSRKILWLFVTRSNNQPHNIAAYYLETVNKYCGCPEKLITDLGTENGIMAGIHAFFRNDPDSHRYVPSPRNQRIESWWSFFRRTHTSWWINYFKDLIAEKVDMASQLHSECLWFCFAPLLQRCLNQVRDHWNCHYIRGSRRDTVKGRPDSLYFLPDINGGPDNLMMPVSDQELLYAKEHVYIQMKRTNINNTLIT